MTHSIFDRGWIKLIGAVGVAVLILVGCGQVDREASGGTTTTTTARTTDAMERMGTTFTPYVSALSLSADDVRIMKANLIRDGLDLIIRDEDEALVHSLRVAGDLSDPEAITLEDLFIALMGGGGSLQAIQAEEVQA